VQKEQCFSLGKITKLHGYKGAVVLHIDSSTPQYFKNLESVLLEINKELVPFFFEQRGKQNGKKMIVHFEDVDLEVAQRIIGCSAYLPNEMLPEPPKGEFYDKAIIGFKAITNAVVIGEVIDVIENGAQNLFVIEHKEGEYLVPAVQAFIQSFDEKKKEIYLELPDGLLDL
jgi:16S rRNA processing protein RimM